MFDPSRRPRSLDELRQLTAEALYQHFTLRWVLANMIGWSAAFIIASRVADWLSFLGPVAPGLAAVAIGGVVGGCQWFALSDFLKVIVSLRRWVIWSALGGLLGVIPVGLVASFGFLLGNVTAYALMGAMFGLCLGAVQSLALFHELPELPLVWLAANGLGGCLCGLFALGMPPFGLPVLCTIGPPLFGIVTAAAWHLVLSMDVDDEADQHESE